jgi:hypothetical protein
MKHLSAILALTILLTVGLACSDSGETTATGDNSTTQTKTEPESGAVAVKSVTLMNADDETVTSFKTSDLAHKASIEFSKMGAGKVRGVFTAVNAGGEKNVKILEKEIELTSVMNTANFTLKLDQPFPAGDYKLDVYLNDKLVKTHNYKVQ